MARFPPASWSTWWRHLRGAAARRLPKPALDLYYAARALDRATIRRNRHYGRLAPDGLPIPGPERLVAVAGSADIGWFLDGGARAAAGIVEALARHGVAPQSIGALLDFGCGCGRVVRHWQAWTWADIHGCDVDARALAWCRRHLPFARLERNALAPPLPYPDAALDLVYALSVLTHTPADLQRAWMADLHRVLRPGAWLIITTHGDSYRDELTAAERSRYASGQPVVRHHRSGGTNRCGAYHPPRYVREVLADGFTVLEHRPDGARGNPHQDQWLLRRVP